jgi:hypothetical protein
LDRLESCEVEQEFRILWFSAAALVRLVGDALDKADAAQGPAFRKAIDEAYLKRQKDHPLYRDFIKKERDRLVHRYESSVAAGDVQHVAIKTEQGVFLGQIGDCMYKPLTDGPFDGEDVRDILSDVIEWWAAEIDWIEAKAAE